MIYAMLRRRRACGRFAPRWRAAREAARARDEETRDPKIPGTAGINFNDRRTCIDHVELLECVIGGVDYPTLTDIPERHDKHWAEVNGAIIGWLNGALRSGDERQIATAARWYFARSALFLRITRGGSRGRAQLAARF